jgi:acetoin utilization deacetylase AcuC-like enzyme
MIRQCAVCVACRRVLYLDIDVHHGDGVEEAFYTTGGGLGPRCAVLCFGAALCMLCLLQNTHR